ncbi:unnamed protein product [Caenorhabditis bovis]|uniref:Domain of unknown function DX domain-containing protein n=1 Tax=Caenorhabditis bovis TaxID=2654633 RepID=A0A8S1E8C2_9PELO|nr:unnamed protein product [Caenorhabditis bovis]
MMKFAIALTFVCSVAAQSGPPMFMFAYSYEDNECFFYNMNFTPANSYNDIISCERAEVDKGRHVCPAGVKVHPNLDGDADGHCDSFPDKKCDSDTSTCLPGYTYGLCCDTLQLEAYNNDMLAECPNGRKLRYTDLALPWYAHDMRVVAKSCDVLQCPTGYYCHTGLDFAYCCPNEFDT